MSSGRDRGLPLFDEPGPPAGAGTSSSTAVPTPVTADDSARQFAVDPRHNVVLEASAGTGKTSVLVARYINLLRAGVDPANILAMTFTRKAAAEMRDRIVSELRAAAARSEIDRERWRGLRDRLSDIAISTIDAFCLSLLREFPLEADLDPGFSVADETEVPRLMRDAIDRTLRVALDLAGEDADIALLLTQLGADRLRDGLATLLDRRLVAPAALSRFLDRAPGQLSVETVAAAAVDRLRLTLEAVPGGAARFIADGPQDDGRFQQLARDLGRLSGAGAIGPSARGALDRARDYFLTRDGKPRTRPAHPRAHFPSAEAYRRHRDAVAGAAPAVAALLHEFQRGLNMVLVRGVRRLFAVALDQYRRTLEANAVIDFTEALVRAIELLRQMDEFARSRYRLESRYHHVLVDEFQDTSRAQWELVSLLIRSWGEGAGLQSDAPVPPTIFIVGDRKQSIYRFRDAEVALLEDAAALIGGLRSGPAPRRWISRSFRALAPLLQFVNDLFDEMEKAPGRRDAFRYDETDRFPVEAADSARAEAEGASNDALLGLCLSPDVKDGAAAVAAEIARLLQEATIRDRRTGLRRSARPGDIAILFRARESHRDYEHALRQRGIPSYVYKGLGFFDADEVLDLTALIRFLARPRSSLRAAAFVRSRLVRLSDPALALLGSHLARTLTHPGVGLPHGLPAEDVRVLTRLRASLAEWLPLVDRLPPAEVIDRVIAASAYLYELSGSSTRQPWENVKKLRSLVRRIQNRGYATMAQIADHLQRLSAGDESNAVVDALEAVNLMTAHAAKGLEFPVVFLVQLERGAGGADRPIRVAVDDGRGEPSVSVGPFQSETDEDERAREREETKRLLYVSLTRARDRLYLAATLRNGEFRPAGGGLGEVLPESMKSLFSSAAQAPDDEGLGWAGPTGRVHRFRRCHARPPADAPAEPLEAALANEEEAPGLDDFGRLAPDSWARAITVTALVAPRKTPDPTMPAGDADSSSDALLGTLIHRFFERAGGDDQDAATLRRYAVEQLRSGELPDGGEIEEIVARAVRAYQQVCARPDVQALLSGGECLFEVPFSIRLPGTSAGEAPATERGVIDCIVLRGDAAATVVEFKTGVPRPHHRLQLERYVRAARLLMADRHVNGVIVHP